MRGRVLTAARAVAEPAPERLEKALAPAPGRPPGRWRSGAARPSARRRRRWPPTSSGCWHARTSTRRTSACSCARCATRARRSRSRSRSAPCPTGWPAPPPSSSAPRCATCWPGCACWSNPGDAGAVVRALARPPVELRPIDLARCTQIARRRKLDMVAALGAALESPQIPPEARERIAHLPQALSLGGRRAGLDPARPLRPPPDRAARPAPPALVRRLRRGGRAAREPREVRRPGRGVRAPLAAGHGARVRALDRGGGGGRAARGGGDRRRAPARRPGDGHARRQGAASSNTSTCSG